MKKFVSSLILCGVISAAEAQTTPQSSGQTMTGILMDASCAAISSNRTTTGSTVRTYSPGTQAASSNDAVMNSTTSTSAVTHSGRSSPTEGMRNNSASAQGTTGTADTTGSTAGRAATDRNATSATSQSTTEGARAADERRRTGSTTSSTETVTASSSVTATSPSSVDDRSASAGATSGANSASALGTTGAAPDSATAVAGDRNRSADSGITTVREKYAQCVPSATTTSFALHANGQLYVLDQASNDIVRQQMSGEAFRGAMSNASGQPQWMTVTVSGTPGTGNNLTITSIRK